MGLFDRLRGRVESRCDESPVTHAQHAVPTVDATWLQWPTIAWGSLHAVAGEGYRQAELRSVAGMVSGVRTIEYVTAQLVPEPTNPHDRNAIKVLVGGAHVGYVPAYSTSQFHRVIAQLARRGRPATCRAQLTGGRPPKDNIGITLLVSNPLAPCTADTPFLSCSRTAMVTVTKEELYQDALERLTGRHDRLDTVARLVPVEGGLVGVEIGPDLVGVLTPKMSARYLPVIAEVTAAGIAPTCPADVHRDEKGRLQVRLLLQARS